MTRICALITAGVVPVLLLGTACSATPDEGSGAAPSSDAHGAHSDADAHKSSRGSGTSHGDRHDQGHRSDGPSNGHQPGPAVLAADLLSAADIPEGYAAGTAHHQVSASDAGPPKVDPACAPIAELIGTHPSVRQHQHPQASVTFTKSHFGPELSETIVDYGAEAAAAEAFERVVRSSKACDRYIQSTAPTGANIYTVAPTEPLQRGPRAAAMRLDAVGGDFNGLHWDIWLTQSAGTLVAVAFRSVPGGDNDDLAAAIPAAMSALKQS